MAYNWLVRWTQKAVNKATWVTLILSRWTYYSHFEILVSFSGKYLIEKVNDTEKLENH